MFGQLNQYGLDRSSIPALRCFCWSLHPDRIVKSNPPPTQQAIEQQRMELTIHLCAARRLRLCTLVTRHMDGTHILICLPSFTLLFWNFLLCTFQDTAIPVSAARNLCYCLHSGSLRFKCQRSNVATWHRKLSIPPTGVCMSWLGPKQSSDHHQPPGLPCLVFCAAAGDRTACDQHVTSRKRNSFRKK